MRGNLLLASAGIMEIELVYKWAEDHLSDEEVINVKSSHKTYMKKLSIFIITFIILFGISFFGLFSYSKSIALKNRPVGTVIVQNGWIDSKGNVAWTNDSKAFKQSLASLSLNKDDFKYLENVDIYIDANNKLLKVEKREKFDPLLYGLILLFVFAFIFLFVGIAIFISRAKKTFARDWLTAVYSYRKGLNYLDYNIFKKN